MNASSSEPLSKARTAIVTWQAKLLDVSKGNRLLRFRQTRLSTVPIDEPDLATLFEWFVLGERSIPVISDARDEEQTREMLWDEVPEPEAGALKHSPMRGILSPYPPKQLQAALYNLRQKAQSSIEERGVNILHVALGFLVWNDAQDKDLESHAPLILAPIVIERIGLSKYTVKALDEDAVLNPTLAYKLHLDHGLDLPELPDDWEGRCFCSYLDSIQRQVDQLPGATIDQATFIGLFSFLKIPMYEDLTRNTDALLGHPLVARLAGIPAPMPSGLGLADEATPLDEIIDPKAVLQVLDADSSQQEALLAIRNGSHLVLQGPPGTGKSQTITNLIAEALSTGKKVMFVSEKEAALTIVKRHLDRCGLGDACLELHGHQADKKKVLGELERTLYAPRLSAPSTAEPKFAELVSERNALNRYVDALHTPRYAAGLTAFEVYGRLARLRSATKLDFTLGSAVDLTANDLQQRQTCLDVLTVHDQVIDHLADHPWLGLRARPPSPAFENELRKHLQSLRQIGQDLELGLSEARLATGLTWTDNMAQLEQATRLFAKYRCQILALPGSEWHQRFNDRYSPKHRVVQLGYWRDANRLRSLCRSAWTWHYPTIVADLADLQQVQAWLVPESQPSPDDSILVPHAKRLGELAAQARAELDYFRDQMDESGAFQKLDLASNLLRVVPWCDSHLDSLPRVGEYLAFAHDRDTALSAGLGSFVEAATATSTPAREWPNAYLRAYYEAWLGTAVQDASELGYFGRAAHEKHILRFCELDREQLKLAAQLIMAKVSQDRPEPNDFTANIRSAEITVLLRELKKQRKIKPLRKLFREAPHVIQALKPCLMMSPLSVSQFIEPGSFQFDLVVFDEASQVKVEDAIGSIYRGHQLVVAGDSRQLPPTCFFDVMTTDEEWDEDTEDVSDVYESILDALTPILPEKMLHWHYRSRHETLIALSNKEFYRGKLFTFPSPAETGSDRAIDFVYVPDGLYERGGGRRNMVEARRVVDLIVRHAQEHSDWSLAVVTFSEAQREAVEHEVEARLTTQLGLKRFIDDEHNRGEPYG